LLLAALDQARIGQAKLLHLGQHSVPTGEWEDFRMSGAFFRDSLTRSWQSSLPKHKHGNTPNRKNYIFQ
jgi:hypothetical protein